MNESLPPLPSVSFWRSPRRGNAGVVYDTRREAIANGEQLCEDLYSADQMREYGQRCVQAERERAARVCETFAQMMLDGAGDGFPGGRLWQAARDIRAGDPVPSWYDPERKEPTDEEAAAIIKRRKG